jgi:hypothetical protein
MSDLATSVSNAHGGLDQWRKLKTVSARLLPDGVLWKLKGPRTERYANRETVLMFPIIPTHASDTRSAGIEEHDDKRE